MAKSRRKGPSGKKRRKVVKKYRRRQRGKGIDLVGALNKLNPPEMHLPGYRFAGPFTKLKKRLDKNNKPHAWSKPKNRLDALALKHDLDYQKISQMKIPKKEKQKKVWAADKKMIDGIQKFKKKTVAEHVANTVLKVKRKVGM